MQTTSPLTQQAARGHVFAPAILREYDIRGVAGESLTDADAYHIGRAFGSVVRGQGGSGPVCVGYDGRLSSPALEEALVKGLSGSGADVARIGLGPTPMLYYSVYEMNAGGGVMVTGSHNPPAHNGFKFMLGKRAFFGEEIKRLGERAARGGYASGQGAVTTHDMRERYIARLLSAYTAQAPLSAAWDAGNGAAGEIVQALCERLPGRHIPLFAAIDGSFPNHHPDPAEAANLADLIATVRREKCNLGLAFDGDGDRVGVVDENGDILWPDQLMLLYAQDLLARRPGATVIADVKASRTLFDGVRAAGGAPLMWKTGHSHIKSKMLETGAELAGEMSGHIFFADGYYGFDDGLYAAVRLLDILARGGEPLARWRTRLPAVFATPEIRFACPEERKFAVIGEAAARLTAAGEEFCAVDGVRMTTPDGWWLLRASNTQAALSARCEAATEEGLERLKRALSAQLAASGLELPENE